MKILSYKLNKTIFLKTHLNGFSYIGYNWFGSRFEDQFFGANGAHSVLRSLATLVLLGDRMIQHCALRSRGGVQHTDILRGHGRFQEPFSLIGLGLFQHRKWFIQLLFTSLKNVMANDENLGI